MRYQKVNLNLAYFKTINQINSARYVLNPNAKKFVYIVAPTIIYNACHSFVGV